MRLYEFVVIALRWWFIGMFLIAIYALSDSLFRKKASVRLLMARLWMAVVWPVALCSRAGRNTLLGKLEERET